MLLGPGVQEVRDLDRRTIYFNPVYFLCSIAQPKLFSMIEIHNKTYKTKSIAFPRKGPYCIISTNFQENAFVQFLMKFS